MRTQRAGLFLLLLLAAAPKLPADAASPFLLSARVYWADEKGLQEDARVDLFGLGGDWKKEGEELVYTGEAAAGETLELMQGVVIPKDWGNEMAGAHIFLVIEATLWQNPEAVGMQDDSLRPVISEFQRNSQGEEEPYVNGKTVLPGEKISKIVRIRLDKTGSSAASEADAQAASGTEVENRIRSTMAPTGLTDAIVIPIGSSGGEVHLPASGGVLPSIRKSRAEAPAPGEYGVSRSAKTADAFDPLVYAAGILAGLAVLALWFWTGRRRD